jgi:hypothetical protein
VSAVYFVTPIGFTAIPIPDIVRAVVLGKHGIGITIELRAVHHELSVANESSDARDHAVLYLMLDDLMNFHVETPITWTYKPNRDSVKPPEWIRTEGMPAGRGVWAK